MLDLAQHRRTQAAAADTPARRTLRFLAQPAALGLLFALLAAVLLGNWFHRQAAVGLVADEQSRIAILEGSALADFVAGKLAADPEGTESLQAALVDWVERSPYDDSIRVVRLGGAQLLASTHAAERAESLPRRLTRDEKWLFDLGQELRAAADTNAAEGVFRKPQIDVSRPAPDRIRVTVPYLDEGAITGFVQHERPLDVSAVVIRPPLPLSWLLIVPLAVLWLAATRLNPVGGVAAGANRWILFMLALGRFFRSLVPYSGRAVDSLAALAGDGQSAVAQSYQELRDRVAGEAAGRMTGGGTAVNAWDVDEFQRPRGLLAADGSIDPAASAAAIAAFQQPFAKALGATGCSGR